MIKETWTKFKYDIYYQDFVSDSSTMFSILGILSVVGVVVCFPTVTCVYDDPWIYVAKIS